MRSAKPLLAAIETGGTTTRVALGRVERTAPAGVALVERAEFPTGDPAATVERAVAWLREKTEGRASGRSKQLRLAALGVAAFGPIDVDPASPKFGTLLATPKLKWSSFPLGPALKQALRIQVALDTDVNAAALAEQAAAEHAGAAAGTLVYVTVGTGIGVGVALDGRAHHGALHPEAGHLRVRRRRGDRFGGSCPFHADCLEGIASGTALEARKKSGESELDQLASTADALAELTVTLVALLAPHAIVFGGGVMGARGLLGQIRRRAVELSGGYSPALASAAEARTLLVSPRLGREAGLLGALRLAANQRSRGRDS